MCVKGGVLQLDWYPRLDDSAGQCKLPIALIKGTVASNNAFQHDLWRSLCAPLIRAAKHNSFIPSDVDALATSDSAAIFRSDFMLKHGTPIIVTAMSFIGLPSEGEDTVRVALGVRRRCADHGRGLPERGVGRHH